jgi:hypothetical protein
MEGAIGQEQPRKAKKMVGRKNIYIDINNILVRYDNILLCIENILFR